MNTITSRINPFFAARRQRTILPAITAAWESLPRYAKLPEAPRNGSPVPHLTSLYHRDDAGDYGSRKYPGNCGGELIKDLITFYRAKRVFDPMSGSGTCRDVCRELKIDCWSNDIHRGFDLCDPREFFGDTRRFDRQTFDFAWLHPPYWRMKLYADTPQDLSRAPTLEAFLDRYAQAIAHTAYVLQPGGKLVVLMGDYMDKDDGMVPLTWHTKRIAFECGLRQCATDIIRFSYGASSGKKVYRSAFIPGLHDVCMIFEKAR